MKDRLMRVLVAFSAVAAMATSIEGIILGRMLHRRRRLHLRSARGVSFCSMGMFFTRIDF